MTTPSLLGPHWADVEPVLDHFFTALTNPDSNIRAIAAYTLGQYGYQSATAALLRVLTDPNATVREEAAYALGALEDVGALAGLLVACNDPDVAVWRTAAEALDKLRPHLRTRATRQHLIRCRAPVTGAGPTLVSPGWSYVRSLANTEGLELLRARDF